MGGAGREAGGDSLRDIICPPSLFKLDIVSQFL